MKLVLLKKLKQSQQLKENVAVLPPNIPQSALPPTGLPSGLSITPTTVKLPSNNKPQQPQIAHSRSLHKPPGQANVTPLLRGVLCFFYCKFLKIIYSILLFNSRRRHRAVVCTYLPYQDLLIIGPVYPYHNHHKERHWEGLQVFLPVLKKFLRQ